MPLMPYISPAAMGWTVVRFRGWPVSLNLAPTAASIASGQASPLEELIVTIASSGISAAACAAERTCTRFILDHPQESHRPGHAGPRAPTALPRLPGQATASRPRRSRLARLQPELPHEKDAAIAHTDSRAGAATSPSRPRCAALPRLPHAGS